MKRSGAQRSDLFAGPALADGRQFDVVFRAEYPRLVAFGVAMSGNVEVAADLAQETMARAHRRWEEVAVMDSPEGWLRRVMANLLIDHHRRSRAERDALSRLAPPPPVEQVVAGDLSVLLAILPPRQRAVVALYYLEDASVGAISDALAIAPGTVKALLWKARRKLAATLGEAVRP